MQLRLLSGFRALPARKKNYQYSTKKSSVDRLLGSTSHSAHGLFTFVIQFNIDDEGLILSVKSSGVVETN